jgi:hypothetical protein
LNQRQVVEEGRTKGVKRGEERKELWGIERRGRKLKW